MRKLRYYANLSFDRIATITQTLSGFFFFLLALSSLPYGTRFLSHTTFCKSFSISTIFYCYFWPIVQAHFSLLFFCCFLCTLQSLCDIRQHTYRQKAKGIDDLNLKRLKASVYRHRQSNTEQWTKCNNIHPNQYTHNHYLYHRFQIGIFELTLTGV